MAKEPTPPPKAAGEIVSFTTEALEASNSPADAASIFVDGVRGITQIGGVVRISFVDTVSVRLDAAPMHRHVINLALTDSTFALVADHLKAVSDDMRSKGLLK